MELTWLRTYVAFAEAHGFSAAARKLHLSQPAVHMQVQRLAAELGVALYRRVGRGIELTADGVRVLAFAREMLTRIHGFADEVRTGRTGQPVTLAAGEGAFLYVLGPAIQAFVRGEQAPLRLLTRDREGTLEAVRSGEAQLGVAALDSASADFATEALVRVGQVAVVPRRHRLARRREVRLRDLAGETLVVPPAGRPHRDALARALLAEQVPWTVGVEAHGWELLVCFASLGLGVAIVNEHVRVPAGTVARPVRGLGPIEYHLIRRRGAPLDGASAALRATVLAFTRGRAGSRAGAGRPGSAPGTNSRGCR